MTATTLRSRLARTALITAAAIGFAAGSGASPADASIGQIQARINIVPTNTSGWHNVRVTGHIPMTQSEAQGLVASGHYVAMTLWGEDPGPDDLVDYLIGRRWWPSARGLEFSVVRDVRDSKLNEDWGTDEVYSAVRLCNSDQTLIRSYNTFSWTQSF